MEHGSVAMTPESGKLLRESRDLYRLLAENSTGMISKHTLEGVYTYVSPACRSLLGYEPEDLVGRSAYEFFHPEDLERISRTHSTILRRPDVHTVSYRIRRKDGSYVWFETTGYAVADTGAGGMSEIVAVSRDATGRKRVEGVLRESQEAIRKSEEFHRFAVEAGRIGSWDLDLRTEECLISPKMAELMGYSRDQTTVPGSQWRESIVPDDRATMADAIAAAIESDTPLDLEFRIALQDGTERWLYSRGGATRDAAGKALSVHGTSIDVTERKQAEEAIRESGRRIENILESITEEFFAVDREWRYTYVNERALHRIRRVKGERLTREELLGRNIWELFPELVGSDIYGELRGALHEQEPAGFEARSPLSQRWFEIQAYPSEEGLSIYGQDITERKRVEEALAREVRAKNDFLADVSHELRTPLTVIRGNAEVGMQLGRGWAHADLLEEIVEASGMMSRMVEDLLFLARSDSESLPLDLRMVPVARLVHGSAKRAEALAREHGASLRTVLSGEGSVRCDAHLIERAVFVLVENAAKYGPPGGQITLSSSTDRVELLIEVADRGPGIPQEELSRVFERYYRGLGSSEERGSGLGLAIVKTIAKAHRGSVEAESTPGEGTRMRLRLPLLSDA